MAQAGLVFAFSGTVTSGTQVGSGENLAGSSFTLRMFVSDLADMTPGAPTGNFAISGMSLDLGSDGTVEQNISSGFSQFSSVYLDPGSTQLVGASDLFGASSFLFGVHLPADAFSDVKNLAGQSSFSLSGLTSSSFSFLSTQQYSLAELNITGFSFSNAIIVPLPAPVAMGGIGLLAAGIIARRRLR